MMEDVLRGARREKRKTCATCQQSFGITAFYRHLYDIPVLLLKTWTLLVLSVVVTDLYDGKVWKEFSHLDGQPYLVYAGNLCLCLNIDWFNPYKETPYSVGAIYLTSI